MSAVDLEKPPVVNASPSASASHWEFPKYLLGRVYLFSIVLLIEYAAIVSVPHPWCKVHRAVAGAIVFFAVLLFLGRRYLHADRTPLELNRRLLAFHAATLPLIAAAHFILLMTPWGGLPLIVFWFAAIPVSALLLFFAFVPTRVFPSFVSKTRVAWMYAVAASAIAVAMSNRLQAMWETPENWLSIFLQRTTFNAVGRVLEFFYPHVTYDVSTYTIVLPNFDGTIAGTCSGIEGLCLTLLFCAGWLWYARRELHFPRALLLVPSAMALIWTLNIFRIVALLAMGNAGHRGIAEHGFHSEAGWIAFNLVAIGFLSVAERVPWLSKRGVTGVAVSSSLQVTVERNVAAVYLLPFLAILVAGMLAKSASSGFEWAYPIRFLAAIAVLWHYKAEYRRIDWTFTWRGPAIGAIVFAMWIALSHWTIGPPNSVLGSALAAMPAGNRIGWLIIRTTAAVLTVPIAEELAFRGFLMRRLMSADVESISYRAVTPLAILLSSLAFGLMHGKLWIAGTVAGVIYAVLTRRTGRLGEAAAAHSTTNLMLAIWVLTRGDWGLW